MSLVNHTERNTLRRERRELQTRITTLLAVIEQCRSALESCHALQVHGEVITKEECNLCRVLEVIKKATQ